jgi:hypothetical protein
MMLKKLLTQLPLLAVLTWQLPAGTFDAVNVYRADSVTALFAKVATLAGNATTYTDTAGDAGNCWRVSLSKGGDESQPSNNGCLPSGSMTVNLFTVKP